MTLKYFCECSEQALAVLLLSESVNWVLLNSGKYSKEQGKSLKMSKGYTSHAL